MSYLNVFVCPFSRKTLRTFAIGGMRTSLSEKAEGYERYEKIKTLSAKSIDTKIS